MARVRLLFACVVASAAWTTWAEVVPWLYDGNAAVASQSDAERRRAAGFALAEVLTRATGLREIPFGPLVDAAIRESERYYVRYGFARREIQPEEDGDAASETRLEIHFERNTLLGLLRRAGLPVWSADRPTVLVWIVLERDATRRVVSASSLDMAEVASTMHREARRRGIVLTFPLMDLQDRGLLETDLWGRFWTAIMRASRRYAADLLILGRVAADPGARWTSRWELRPANGENEPAATFVHRGGSAAAAAGEAVHRLADALAQRFAVRGGDLDTIALTVRGAQTVRGYAALLSYLQSREYINRVDVRAVEPDAMHLRLHSRSGRDQLQELLVMGGYLSASPTGSAMRTPAGAPRPDSKVVSTRRSGFASPDDVATGSRRQWAPMLELTWMGAR